MHTGSIKALLHATGTVTEQCAMVVGQNFGGSVNDTGLLAKATDALNFQAILETIEGFFNAQALLVKLSSTSTGRDGESN